MKKAVRVLSIALVAVMMLSFFAGCSLFGKNTSKYRNATAITVGDTKVSVGKIIDTYNNMYYTYQAYVNAGYFTAESLLTSTINSLVNQSMRLDSYVKEYANTAENHSYADLSQNAKYLTAEQMEYIVSYVKYSVFSALDSYVADYIAQDYKLADKESKDTSRDFPEADKLDAATYAEQLFDERFENEDMSEYMSKYYPNADSSKLDASEYVFKSGDEGLKAIYEEYKTRYENYEEDGEKVNTDPFLTEGDYIALQEKAVKEYTKALSNNYEVDIATFMKGQLADLVDSSVAAKYELLKANSLVEADQTALDKKLTDNYTALVNSKMAEFNMDSDKFVDFVESLSSEYVYYVPEEYQGQYVFVKNILIPFTAKQSAQLKNIKTDLGDETDAYKEKMTEIAAEIAANDFTDNDAEDEKLFTLIDNKLVVDPASTLGKYLKEDGQVVPMEGKTAEETIIELMKMYNTDTASHSATYDYVVRVNNIPSNYTAKWVPEFVEAAKEAAALSKDLGDQRYALCVSTYGIHVVFYVKDVEAETMDFAANKYVTTTAEYRFFKAFYNSQVTEYTANLTEALNVTYKKDAKLITKTAALDDVLSQYGVSYDFSKVSEYSE